MPRHLKILRLIRAFFKVSSQVVVNSEGLSTREVSLMQSYTQLRTDYVLQEGWPMHDGGIDVDEVDKQPSTRYIIATVHGRVVAGMRMAPVRSVEEALSYGMWDNAIERNQFDADVERYKYVIEQANNGEIWDITRLITEANILSVKHVVDRADSRIGLFKAMARGLSVSGVDTSVYWIFTTTEKMMRFMVRHGFEVTPITTARISHVDPGRSSLCIVRPQQVVKALKRQSPLLYMIARSESGGAVR